MSSKRKRNDSKKSEKHSKKIKVLMNAEENQIGSLPNEIQLQILSKVPGEQLAQLRLVCSQWKNLTASSEYGKLLCINIFGDKCVSVRLSQTAAAPADPNPERYVVLKSPEGYSDWIGYYKLRTLFGKYMAQSVPSNQKDAKLTDTELSFDNIEAVLNLKLERVSKYLAPMLFKLIPALISSHFNGIPAAKKACSLLTKTNYMNADGLTRARYINGCLDILKLSRLHLSLDPKLHRFVTHDVYSFFKERATSSTEASDVTSSDRVIFRKALIEMIHYGASQQLQDAQPVFKSYFKQPFEYCFINLLEHSNPFKAALADEIVPVCMHEFMNTTNWLVQRSALAVSHVTDCSFKHYFTEKMKFALFALSNPQSHPEVLRAALLGIFYRAANCRTVCNKLGSLIPTTLFDDLFNSTVDAFVFLPDSEKYIALTVFMMAAFDYPLDLFTEDKLDALHTKLFEFLSNPKVLQSLMPEQILKMVVKNIFSLCWALRTKLKKYLPTYHENILNLIKMPELKHMNLEPEYWISFYFDIGWCISEDFKDTEAKNMIAAIEQGCYEGIAVRKALFLARSEHAAEYLSQTPYEAMKQVLATFPPHTLKPTSLTSLLSTTKLSPKDVPVTKDQWDTYIQSLKQAHSRAAKSLNFKNPLASAKTTKHGVQFGDQDISIVNPSAMKQEMQHIDYDNVVLTVLKWLASTDDLDPALMQQALHVLNNHAVWGVINSIFLKAITILLIKLKPHLNDKQTMSYLMMIGTTLVHGKYLLNALPDLENLVDHMLKFITPIQAVSSELLAVILKLARYPVGNIIQQPITH